MKSADGMSEMWEMEFRWFFCSIWKNVKWLFCSENWADFFFCVGKGSLSLSLFSFGDGDFCFLLNIFGDSPAVADFNQHIESSEKTVEISNILWVLDNSFSIKWKLSVSNWTYELCVTGNKIMLMTNSTKKKFITFPHVNRKLLTVHTPTVSAVSYSWMIIIQFFSIVASAVMHCEAGDSKKLWNEIICFTHDWFLNF